MLSSLFGIVMHYDWQIVLEARAAPLTASSSSVSSFRAATTIALRLPAPSESYALYNNSTFSLLSI